MGRKALGVASSSTAVYETFQAPIYLVRGDTLPAIEMTLKDKNEAAEGLVLDPDDSDTWAPYDLTGATVLFKFKEDGDTEIKETISMVIMGDPTEGKVALIWSNTALDTAGKFIAEIEITTSENKITTVFEQLVFIIREDY